MPINFNAEAERLRSVLETDRAAGAVFARDLASWYDALVRSGQDAVYGNTALSVNRPAFIQALTQALSVTAGTAPAFEAALQQAVTLYWTGATLALATPPPGTGPVTANVVNSAGTFSYNLSSDQRSPDVFVNGLVSSVRAHLTTLSGVTTSLTPSPGGPVPVTYPWTGYI